MCRLSASKLSKHKCSNIAGWSGITDRYLVKTNSLVTGGTQTESMAGELAVKRWTLFCMTIKIKKRAQVKDIYNGRDWRGRGWRGKRESVRETEQERESECVCVHTWVCMLLVLSKIALHSHLMWKSERQGAIKINNKCIWLIFSSEY